MARGGGGGWDSRPIGCYTAKGPLVLGLPPEAVGQLATTSAQLVLKNMGGRESEFPRDRPAEGGNHPRQDFSRVFPHLASAGGSLNMRAYISRHGARL